MTKYIYFFSLILTISSCKQDNTNSPDPIITKKDKPISCAIKFKLGQDDSAYYYIRYCSFEKENLKDGVTYIYSGDSSKFANNQKTRVDSSEKYTLSYRFNESNDTIFNTIKEEDEIQNYKYLLFDSLNVEIDKETFRIYMFERIKDDHTWDEILYFSKEIGLVYGYSKIFKGDKSLIQHSNLENEQLIELRSQLEKESRNRR